MNCSEWEERIGIYAGGDLVDRAEVERHLADCAACCEFAAGLQESLTWLREAHAELPAEAHFAAVRARVLGELSRNRVPLWRRTWVYGLAAAALVFAALVGLRVSNPPAPARVTAPLARVQAPEAPAMERLQPQPPFSRPAKPKRAARRVRHAARTSKPVQTETLLIKLETDNPDVVIYWIAEQRGDE